MKARTRTRITSITLAAVVALGGCASIPTTGPLGSEALPAADAGQVFVEAEGPVAGASPIEITQGFIRAQAAGADDEYRVAKDFLTSERAAAWQPQAATTVYIGEPVLGVVEPEPASDAPPSDNTRVEVGGAIDLAAAVSSSGELVEAAPGASQVISFKLVREGGQWRINEVQDGTYVSQPNFTATHRRVALQFLSVDHTYLVPDVRWYPLRNLAGHVAEGLLAGPSLWLRDAVTTAAPTGTTLQVAGSVQVSGEGVAELDLSSQILAADSDQRALLMAQFNATLQQVPRVRSVRVTAGNVDITVTAASVLQDPTSGVDIAAIVDNQVYRINNEELVLDQGFAPLDVTDVTALAVEPSDGPQGGQFAVVRVGRNRVEVIPRLVRNVEADRTMFSGPALTAPSIDRFGWVWAGSRTEIRVATEFGEETVLAVPWLASSSIDAVRVSRDGARVALVSRSNGGAEGGSTIEIASIVRDDTGAPTQLVQGVTIGGSLATASEVVWIGESTVAAIGASEVSVDLNVYLTPIADFSTPQPVLDHALMITGDLGPRSLYVLKEGGILVTRSATGASWAEVATEVAAAAFPG